MEEGKCFPKPAPGRRMIELEKTIQSNKTIVHNLVPNDMNSSFPNLPNEISELKVGDTIYHRNLALKKFLK